MATRFIGLAVDPVAAGSTLDLLGGSPSFATPTVYVPVETATANQGYRNIDRSNEVRGQRGSVAPIAFQADPSITFTVRLYPSLCKFLFPKGLGGTITPTGTAPAAITTKIGVAPLSSTLQALQVLLVRGGQMDRMTGAWIDTMELNVPSDGDPTLAITMRGLYHKHYVTASPPTPTYTAENPYSTVTLKSMIGSSLTVITCVTSLALTYDNQLKDDPSRRFCKNQNIEVTTASGKYLRRQYPGQNRLGDQQVTGTLGFADVHPEIEDRLRVTQADKLVFELTQDPISPATTPAADELMRITCSLAAFTGGGAGELNDDDDADSSYEFGGYIDPATGGDSMFVEFVTKAAVPA